MGWEYFGEEKPCFCGKGRLLICTGSDDWGGSERHETMDCVECGALYEYSTITAPDGDTFGRWSKRLTEAEVKAGQIARLRSTYAHDPSALIDGLFKGVPGQWHVTESVVSELETRRGHAFSSSQRGKRRREVHDRVEQAVRAELGRAFQAFWPDPRAAYKELIGHGDWDRFREDFERRSISAGLFWLNETFIAELRSSVVNEFASTLRSWRPRKAQPKPVNREPEVLLSRELRPDFCLGDGEENEVPPQPGFVLTTEETRRLSPMPLVFAEELERRGENWSAIERTHESYSHREGVRAAVTRLGELGYKVFPGGVGIEGIYALADLVAFDEAQRPLFVEVLTQASVKLGQHNRKVRLAAAVPAFCFVSEKLPERFLAELPATAYAVSSPWALRTLTGEWIPPFLRQEGPNSTPPRFAIRVERKRSVVYLHLMTANIRPRADPANMVLLALHQLIDRNELREHGYEMRWLIPRLRRLIHPESGLRLDRQPWELRGSDRALQLAVRTLVNGSLPAFERQPKLRVGPRQRCR